MGAVMSCIKSVFRAIGNVLSAIVNGIASIIMAIVNGIATVLNVIISCLTCGRVARRRHSMGTRMGGRHGRTTRV